MQKVVYVCISYSHIHNLLDCRSTGPIFFMQVWLMKDSAEAKMI
jgi:hypothetical protein